MPTTNARKEELTMKTMKKLILGILCICLLFPGTNLSAHSGRTDGSYGSKTKSAIRKFQKKKGMTINGKINKTLLKKLNID